MREAKERVEYERNKENKRRAAKGLDPLPTDNFNTEVLDLCKRLFEEIEQKKKHYQDLERSYRQRQAKNAEYKRFQEEIQQEDQAAWEAGREQRVNNWRVWRDKTAHAGMGKKKGFYGGIKAPKTRMEERP